MIGKTILIADENQATREYLTSVLQERQFKVFGVASGKEALISAWRDHPDLVLFDPTFSDIQDVEFIQKLRQNARSGKMHIIAFSSDPAPARREACRKAGVEEYIIKSSEAVSQLHQALDRLFGAGTIPE
ncbi:MAG: response regulator [Anaerolineales bacterium]|nr:response regulator [Anaerolineales bacterium]